MMKTVVNAVKELNCKKFVVGCLVTLATILSFGLYRVYKNKKGEA